MLCLVKLTDDLHGPIHPQAADIQQHLVGLNAAPAALGVLFIVGFSALVCGLDGCGCVLF